MAIDANRPGRVRQIAVVSIAAAFMASTLYIAARKSVQDFTLVFHQASLRAVPEGLMTGVDMVKRRVPSRSLIVFYMSQPEKWEFGLWQRSLYPDYILIPVENRAFFRSAEFRKLRDRYGVRYALVAGPPPPEVHNRILLPRYPGGNRISVAELGK